ncbi:Pimeloyl-ACP methyl ester carboxylesterase [Natronincola peptidivorans]|uniref:Pimeloyl-ACP methyl ester carboxylesterase n=1 Tax=Natronincola peptidivorans TaxID=426128 RepID=A0A1I0AXR4_9FIRM|nr:alpha/beta hydrolase [Natronincola peptidivorans]SES99160.1 Pimeloyl-ACP methyl ester carboxylesterase [Natronincola peptidivorans]
MLKQEEIHEIDGVKYSLSIKGEGQSIVLLHGSYANKKTWNYQVEDFSQQYKVISYDQRGYGKTNVPTREFSYYEDLKSILDYFNIKKTILVASSFGGSVALDFTLKYPEYVEALVLVGSAANGYKYPARMMLECVLDYFRMKIKGIKYAAKKFEENSYWNYYIPKEQQNRKKFMEIYKSNTAFYQWKQNLYKPLEPLAINQLEKIKVPTLIIEGEYDQDFNKKASELLHSRIKGAERIVIKKCGHLPYFEKPEEFNKIVLKYLEEVSK